MTENEENMRLLKEAEELENQLLSLLTIINPHIKDEFKNELIEYITHCECGLAFEDIIYTIIYLKIHISKIDYEKFVAAGKAMNLNSASWEVLQGFIEC